MQEILAPLFGSLIRHGLTAVGFAGVLSGDDVTAVAGALATLVGVGISVTRTKRLKAS